MGMIRFTPQEKRLAGALLLFVLLGATVRQYRRHWAGPHAAPVAVRPAGR